MRTAVAGVAVGAAVLVLIMARAGVTGPDPLPDPAPEPTDLEAYCATQTAPEPACWSSLFGNNLTAHNDFLDGVDMGPGGLKSMTADEQGLGVTAPVGMPAPFVETALDVEFDRVAYDDGSCSVTLDESHFLGIVRTGSDDIQVYLIGNPVVRTPEGLGIGSSLDDLQQSYDVDVVVMRDRSMLATTTPTAAVDPITGTDNLRSMLFEMDPEGVVLGWRVGADSLVRRPSPCP